MPNKLKRFSLYSFSFVIIQSLHSLLLYSSCHLSVSFIQSSVLILPSLSLSYQVISTRSLHKPSSALSLSQQVIHLYSFSLLASMDNLISQNGENAVNKLHGKSHTPRKVGFCYYCQVFYPNGKTMYEVTQKNTYDEEIIFVDIWRPNNNLHVKPFKAQL